jgi:coatomer protein complex subunit alpha (xenin)
MDSCREVDEVQELLGIAKDYVLALRIELKRKEIHL